DALAGRSKGRGRGEWAAAHSPQLSRALGTLGTQKSEHGEHATVVFRRGGQAQLPEDARYVLLDRALGHDESLRDRLVRPALGDQLQYLALARRECRDRVVPPVPADEPCHD